MRPPPWWAGVFPLLVIGGVTGSIAWAVVSIFNAVRPLVCR